MSYPIRILHVVKGMDPGGVETWLMHILRHIDREKFHMDFLIHTTKPCVYDNEIRDLGGKIITCLHPHNPLFFAVNFRRAIRQNGPYDIIHSHVHHYSGFILRLAYSMGISVRIAHSHNDTSLVQSRVNILRQAYLRLMEYCIYRYATVGLAASEKAAKSLYGIDWKNDKRWRILFCGIDLTPFTMSVNSATSRQELNISFEAFVVGHVGRFTEQKNHDFLIDIFKEVARLEPKAYLLLAGDGKLRTRIENKVSALNLSDKVILLGLSKDIPRLMMGIMDVFVLPSLYEGLPLVILESQAAGLPCVISDNIAGETTIVASLVKRVSLSEKPIFWASKILEVKNLARYKNNSKALRIITDSDFNIDNSLKKLLDIYCNEVNPS